MRAMFAQHAWYIQTSVHLVAAGGGPVQRRAALRVPQVRRRPRQQQRREAPLVAQRRKQVQQPHAAGRQRVQRAAAAGSLQIATQLSYSTCSGRAFAWKALILMRSLGIAVIVNAAPA